MNADLLWETASLKGGTGLAGDPCRVVPRGAPVAALSCIVLRVQARSIDRSTGFDAGPGAQGASLTDGLSPVPGWITNCFAIVRRRHVAASTNSK